MYPLLGRPDAQKSNAFKWVWSITAFQWGPFLSIWGRFWINFGTRFGPISGSGSGSFGVPFWPFWVPNLGPFWVESQTWAQDRVLKGWYRLRSRDYPRIATRELVKTDALADAGTGSRNGPNGSPPGRSSRPASGRPGGRRLAGWALAAGRVTLRAGADGFTEQVVLPARIGR